MYFYYSKFLLLIGTSAIFLFLRLFNLSDDIISSNIIAIVAFYIYLLFVITLFFLVSAKEFTFSSIV